MKSKYIPLIDFSSGLIQIGCVEKTANEWIDWINSEEEYQTKRSDPEFAKIRAHILALVTYMKEL